MSNVRLRSRELRSAAYPCVVVWAVVVWASWSICAVVLLSSSVAHALSPVAPFPVTHRRPAEDGRSLRICSLSRPVCIQARGKENRPDLMALLSALEMADAKMVDVLGLPRPLSDGARGGGPEFDVYLLGDLGLERGSEAGLGPLDGAAVTERDEPRPFSWDSASAFGILKGPVHGCEAANLLARIYANAIGWRIDAAESPAWREARSAYLAELVAPCGEISSTLIDAFQAHPERPLCDAQSEGGGASSLMFPWFLDSVLGAGLATVPTGLLAIGPQRTPPGSLRWEDEPDSWDALRATLRVRPSQRSTGDLLLDFAVARLFWGDRDDGMHGPAASFAGAFGRVRFEWSVPFSTLPRRLAPAAPIQPTGMTYLWLDLEDAPAGAQLGFRAEWESPVIFRWALVRVGRDGRERSRVIVVPEDKTTSAERNVADLDDLAGIAVVGVNVGDAAIDQPFDPDEAPFEPHGYAVTLAHLE